MKIYLQKSYVPNLSEKVFVITKVKYTVPWTYVTSDLKDEEIVGTFYDRGFTEKQIKKSLDLKKIIKRKGDKLYVEWKGYNNYFNSWMDKKDIV